MQTEKEKGLSIGSSKKKILIKYYYERIRRDVTNFIKWMLLAILTGLVVGGETGWRNESGFINDQVKR